MTEVQITHDQRESNLDHVRQIGSGALKLWRRARAAILPINNEAKVIRQAQAFYAEHGTDLETALRSQLDLSHANFQILLKETPAFVNIEQAVRNPKDPLDQIHGEEAMMSTIEHHQSNCLQALAKKFSEILDHDVPRALIGSQSLHSINGDMTIGQMIWGPLQRKAETELGLCLGSIIEPVF